MALTLLPESKSVDMGTDLFRKVMGYQMHGTCIRFSGYSPLLSSPPLPALAVSTPLAVSAVSAVLAVSTLQPLPL